MFRRTFSRKVKSSRRELASMADHHGLTFTQAHCLMRVAKVLEQSSSKFQLKPVHVDWMKLYRDIEDWL